MIFVGAFFFVLLVLCTMGFAVTGFSIVRMPVGRDPFDRVQQVMMALLIPMMTLMALFLAIAIFEKFALRG